MNLATCTAHSGPWILSLTHRLINEAFLTLLSMNLQVVCREVSRIVKSPDAAELLAKLNPSFKTCRVKVIKSVEGGVYS